MDADVDPARPGPEPHATQPGGESALPAGTDPRTYPGTRPPGSAATPRRLARKALRILAYGILTGAATTAGKAAMDIVITLIHHHGPAKRSANCWIAVAVPHTTARQSRLRHPLAFSWHGTQKRACGRISRRSMGMLRSHLSQVP